MTERVIRVIVDPSGAQQGARKVDQALDRTTKKTKETGAGFGALRGLIVAAAGAAVIKQFASLGDQMILLGNRIRLVTDSQAEFNTVQAELFTLANETRSSIESTVELFSRAARATAELGLTQRDVIDLTRGVNQAIQISGATASAAAAGTLQFSQALAGGVVRAEEFNSIVEQTPRLASALADGLGVTRGELRKLVIEGLLTSEDAIKALQSQFGELNDEFGQLAPTLEQGFTVLNNGLVRFVGSINQALNSNASLGKSLDDLGRFFTDAAESAFILARALRTGVAQGFAEIGAFVERTSIQLEFFATSAGLVFDALNPFSDIDADEAFIKIQEAGGRAFVEITKVNENLEATKKLLLDAGREDVIKFIETDPEALDREAAALANAVKESEELRKAREKAEKATLKFVDALKESIDIIELERTLGDDAAIAIERLRLENQLAAQDVNVHTEAAMALIDQFIELKKVQEAELAVADRTEVIEALELELEILKATTEERAKILAIQELGSDASKEEVERFIELKTEIDEITKQQEAAATFNAELIKNSANFIKDSVRGFFDGTIDSFDDLRNNFGQLLQDMAIEFITSALVKQVTDFFTNAFASGGGGIFGQIFGAIGGALGGKQFGGDVQAGVPVRANEGRGEVFIPPSSGQVQPIGQFANQQLGAIQAPNIIFEPDPVGALEAANTAQGQQTFRVQVEENAEFLREILGVPT